MSPRRKSNGLLRLTLITWAGIFLIIIAETIFHAIGWIIVTLVLMAVSYRMGTRNAFPHARNRLRSNKGYGQINHYRIPGIVHEPADPRAYRGGSYPREPVRGADAVSPYPPDLTIPNGFEPVRDDPRAVRARLLRDRMSGARRLFGGNDNERP
jgi:hypothetical protein